jgi:hypothetical protein
MADERCRMRAAPARTQVIAVLSVGVALALAPRMSDAQLIPVKTIPLAEGEQFGFFPTPNLGMAGVSIALRDSMRDAFANPAKGARLSQTSFFGSPSFYSVSNDAGGGSAMPIGMLARRGATFAGLALAVQEVSPARQAPIFPFFGGFGIDVAIGSFAPSPTPEVMPANSPQSNRYAFAMLGHSFGRGLSLGASAFWSGLRAVDGADLLYIGSRRVEQDGHSHDLRLGVLKELSGDRSIEALVLHNRFDVSHQVGFADFFFDPATRGTRMQERFEGHRDGSRTVGAQVAYEMPLQVGDSGWRAGTSVTANRISHDEVPYYLVQNMPRDAGTSHAFNVGAGISRQRATTKFGADLIYEPIWRRTGSDSSNNRFRFSNVVARAGASRDFELAMKESTLQLQLGVQARQVSYELDRWNLQTGAMARSHRHWTEWMHTWGAAFLFPRLEVHYQFRIKSGNGRAGVTPRSDGDVVAPDPFFRGGFLQPTASTSIHPVRQTTQQFFVSVPIR